MGNAIESFSTTTATTKNQLCTDTNKILDEMSKTLKDTIPIIDKIKELKETIDQLIPEVCKYLWLPKTS